MQANAAATIELVTFHQAFVLAITLAIVAA